MTWLNTPYVPRANVKGVGVDCGMMLYEVYNPYFGPFKQPPDYSADWALHMPHEKYLDFIMPYVRECSIVHRGGFSLFHMGLNYAHAAIYLGNNEYIHAWGRLREGGVTISKARVLNNLAGRSGHAPRHFQPVKQ